MRLLLFLAFLTVLAAAQEQIPLGDRVQGWFGKAKSIIQPAAPVVPQQKVQEPAKVPEKPVTSFNLNNYKSLLEPSAEPQDWFIYITGRNKTCFGRCDRADKAFDVRLSTDRMILLERNELMDVNLGIGQPIRSG